MSGFKVKKFGAWGKAFSLLSSMSDKIDKGVQKGMKQIGLKGEQLAIKHLQSQDLGWQPLSKAYKRAKEIGGFSDKILIRTSTLFQNIRSEVIDKKMVFVGVKREAKYADGSSVADIATIMEYGSKAQNIPARPLWQPTQKELIEWIKKENIILKNVKKELGF
jgi:hypothetical protein